MRGSRPSRPSLHAAFTCARLALVALALATAFAAGCGGGAKSGSDASSSSGTSTTPATPAPAETTAAPAPAPAGASGSGGSAASAADLGAKVFATRCALCHGPDGHGDGPGSKGLKPQPRNFHDTAYMSSRTDAQLLETIHKGKGPMPRWQGILSEAEMTAVLAHIRTLGKKP